MNVSVMKQVEQLETECNDEEKAHWQRVAKLHEHNQVHYVQLQISFHAKFRLVAGRVGQSRQFTFLPIVQALTCHLSYSVNY